MIKNFILKGRLKKGVILITSTFSFLCYSQDKLKHVDVQSYFYSYEIKDSTGYSEDGQEAYYAGSYKVWKKKEIGYFSRTVCDDCDSSSEWNWVNEFNNSDKSQIKKYSIQDGLPYGEWDFGKYEGRFNNGKQDGEWILHDVASSAKFTNGTYQGEQEDTLEIHEFYKEGIADGQWYTIKNGLRYNTYNFKDGKLDGEIITNFGGNNCIDKANYKNGVPNGSFILYKDRNTYDKDLYMKGSYNMGNPNGIWECKYGREYVKIEFLDSLELVRYTEVERSKKKTIEYFTSDNFSVNFENWFTILDINCTNKKNTEYFENGKTERIWHIGTDEFRKGKKDQEFHPNGKIKIEGVLDEYRKEFDMNGKLIKSSDNYKSLFDGQEVN